MTNPAATIFREAKADNLTGESAKVAYYLFLSIFPLILVLFAVTGIFGGEAAFNWIMGRIREAVPPETATFLGQFVREVTQRPSAGVLSIGLLLTLWAASGGVAALADGLNAMYDVEESRSWWKKRAIALGLLVVGVILLVGGAAVILAGPEIARALGLGAVWNLVRWPITFVLVGIVMALVYYYLPNRDQSDAKWRVLAGAVIGTVLWIGATLLFRLYVSNFGSYDATYGAVGAVIVLMLWLYLTALTILLGGEVASVLQKRKDRRGAGARESTLSRAA